MTETTVTQALAQFRAGQRAVGAVEMVVGLGVTVIALYIIILIAGSFSGAANDIGTLPQAWNDTLAAADKMAGSTFNIASLAPLAIAGVGILGIVIGGLYIRNH